MVLQLIRVSCTLLVFLTVACSGSRDSLQSVSVADTAEMHVEAGHRSRTRSWQEIFLAFAADSLSMRLSADSVVTPDAVIFNPVVTVDSAAPDFSCSSVDAVAGESVDTLDVDNASASALESEAISSSHAVAVAKPPNISLLLVFAVLAVIFLLWIRKK